MSICDTTTTVDRRSLVSDVHKHYDRLETQYKKVTISLQTTYRTPVNFSESMRLPRHRWFPYKEGFSPSFVRGFIDDYYSGNGAVFDPFSGSGTTAIVAGELGIQAIGFDVSSLAVFVAKVKAYEFTFDQIGHLNQEIRCFERCPLRFADELPANQTVTSYFEKDFLIALLKVKHYYKRIVDPRISDLFKLAFLASVETFSTHRRAGNGVKPKTRYSKSVTAGQSLELVRRDIVGRLYSYLSDLKFSRVCVAPYLYWKSCLIDQDIRSLKDIDLVLTSPPYANCFDYSKIYMRELWLGDFFQSRNDQQNFRMASVRSHVHATWRDRFDDYGSTVVDECISKHIGTQQLWSNKIPGMLSGYFKDIGRFLNGIRPQLKKNAHLGVVVGNSVYGGMPIATDLLIASIGEKFGYSVDSIKIYRSTIPSSQQFKALGGNKRYQRESLVVFRN